MDPHYRLVAEVMIMTGMIASEIAGLRKSDLMDDHIKVQNSRVRGIDKEDLKTSYRHRKIPLTGALRERLAAAEKLSKGEHLFSMKSGIHFREGSFRQNPWTTAFKKAGLDYKVPYTTRHSFAAWALVLAVGNPVLV